MGRARRVLAAVSLAAFAVGVPAQGPECPEGLGGVSLFETYCLCYENFSPFCTTPCTFPSSDVLPGPRNAFDTFDLTYYYANNLVAAVGCKSTTGPGGVEYMLQGTIDSNSPGYIKSLYGDVVVPAAPNMGMNDVASVRILYIQGVSRMVTADTRYTPEFWSVFSVNEECSGIEYSLRVTFNDYWGDNNCKWASADLHHFMCLNGLGEMHVYSVPAAGSTFEHVSTLQLTNFPGILTSTPTQSFYGGGTFAFDGHHFFVSEATSGNIHYWDAAGNYISVFQPLNIVTGQGPQSVFFDWNLGRYSMFDGYGQIATDGTQLPGSQGSFTNDAQSFTPAFWCPP